MKSPRFKKKKATIDVKPSEQKCIVLDDHVLNWDEGDVLSGVGGNIMLTESSISTTSCWADDGGDLPTTFIEGSSNKKKWAEHCDNQPFLFEGDSLFWASDHHLVKEKFAKTTKLPGFLSSCCEKLQKAIGTIRDQNAAINQKERSKLFQKYKDYAKKIVALGCNKGVGILKDMAEGGLVVGKKTILKPDTDDGLFWSSVEFKIKCAGTYKAYDTNTDRTSKEKRAATFINTSERAHKYKMVKDFDDTIELFSKNLEEVIVGKHISAEVVTAFQNAHLAGVAEDYLSS